MQSAEPVPGLSEFDLRYYGWRGVLAALQFTPGRPRRMPLP